jgi:hypothetical protein
MRSAANAVYSVCMATTIERDHYLFGNLESSARNRAKLKEVSYGFEEPEGVCWPRWMRR